MNRRELLGTIGAVGTSLTVGGAALHAHDSDAGKDGKMTPLGNHHAHFCGIHVAKKDPKIQIITQHFCGMVGEEMHQCLLYDAMGHKSRLLGVEYIISDRLFRNLPDEEKKYWHPHTYEVLAGGLIAPEMTADDEMKFMKGLLTTWGKTWHTWPDPKTPVPMGEPLLMWSLTADGQEDAKVFAERDKAFHVETAKIRKKRIETIGLEVPRVPQPPSLDAIGRQWTGEGEDKPTRRKKK
jgi:hypothetical protein